MVKTISGFSEERAKDANRGGGSTSTCHYCIINGHKESSGFRKICTMIFDDSIKQFDNKLLGVVCANHRNSELVSHMAKFIKDKYDIDVLDKGKGGANPFLNT